MTGSTSHRQASERFPSILSLADLEPLARKVLPRLVFGYYAGAAETDSAMLANRASFQDWAFRTRVLVGVAQRQQKVELFGRIYNSPVGIAPMGGAALSRYRGEVALARAARTANVPFILSGASTTRLEEVRDEGGAEWFQAYLVPDAGRINALAERVERAGYQVMVVTADLPVGANRENNVRLGYSSPLRLTPRVVLDGLTHPKWLVGTALATLLRSGIPHVENYDADRGYAIVSNTESHSRYRRDGLSWEHVALLRRKWRGRLVLKGVLSAEDTVTAREMGIDAVIVSNHGGRQLDGAVAPLVILPEVVDAARDLPVMLDGGVLRGTDVLKAVALGARMVFIGRPLMYALAVGGEDCVLHALTLMRDEVDRNMAMLGCRDLASVQRHLLVYRGHR